MKTVPGSAGASHVAMAAGPGGRLWLAWDTPSDDIGAVRTSTTGLKFGAVRNVSTPGSSTVYGVNIEGSSGTANIVFNDSTRIRHTQVIPGLTLKASPSKWNGDKAVEVKFKVADAGQGVAGAKVKILGQKCTTAGNGVCKIDLPKLAEGKYKAKATPRRLRPRQGQAQGHLTRTTDLPSARRSSMSSSARPKSSRLYVAPIGGSSDPDSISGSRAAHCSCM